MRARAALCYADLLVPPLHEFVVPFGVQERGLPHGVDELALHPVCIVFNPVIVRREQEAQLVVNSEWVSWA